MKKILILLLCTVAYQTNYGMNQLITRKNIEDRIKARDFTFKNDKTGFNYDQETGDVFHDYEKIESLKCEQVRNATCIFSGFSVAAIGCFLNQPLCWILGLVTAVPTVPRYYETKYELRDNRRYMAETMELERDLKQIITKKKKQQ